MQRFESIDKETMSDWLADPTTEAFIRTLSEDREEAVERLVNLIKKPGDQYAQNLEHVGGRLAAIDDLLGRLR